MSRPGLVRLVVKEFALRCLFRAREIPGVALRAKALVFAPHPDDDALGCGGLISHKKKAGAGIDIVYMTDGRKSHSHLVDATWLAALRKDEARASAFCLGVQSGHLHFLGYEDGRLSSFIDQARSNVEEILLSVKPEQIIVPSYLEKHADHTATHTIVMEALRNYGLPVEILEYPVWAWYSWPFVGLSVRGRSEIPRGLYESSRHVYRLARRLRWGIGLDGVMEQKRMAIAAHHSQMIRLVNDSRWGILEDVADGEFLERLVQKRELYCRRSVSAASSGVADLGKISRRAA